MEYRSLGSTDLTVSSFGLGTWMFGREGNTDVRECASMVRSVLDAGINLIDTADVYSGGEAETIVGAALHRHRHEVLISTKVGYRMADEPGSGGLSPHWIRDGLEASLKRLGTDYVDIYLLHRPDPDTDITETLGTLNELVRAGKVRVAGCSTFPAWQIAEAQCVSERRGWAPLLCEQPPYSILVRAAERDVFPVAARYGMGVVVWGALAGGWLTGKYHRGEPPPSGSRGARASQLGRANSQVGRRYDPTDPANADKFEAVARLEELARDLVGVPLPALALAFTQAHPAVTATLIGPRTLDQLREMLRFVDVRLDGPLLDRVDAIVGPGRVLNDADRGWDPPWMAAKAMRR